VQVLVSAFKTHAPRSMIVMVDQHIGIVRYIPITLNANITFLTRRIIPELHVPTIFTGIPSWFAQPQIFVMLKRAVIVFQNSLA
jgi:hypothetical protein